MGSFRASRQMYTMLVHHLSKSRGRNRCSYSVFMDAERPDLKPKGTKPVYEKFAASVTSFVQSYIARFSEYPSLALVAEETGASKKIARQILSEIKSKRIDLEHEKVSVEDDMAFRHLSAWTDCAPDLVRSNEDSVCLDDENVEGSSLEVEAAATEDLTDDNDIEQGVDVVDVESSLLKRALKGEEFADVGQDVVHSDNVDVGQDVVYSDNVDGIMKKKRAKVLGNPALFTLFGEAMQSSSEDVNRRVAPLMDILQQKNSNASRRVHFSASGGTKINMSWEKTLLSILPKASNVTNIEAGDEKSDVDSIEDLLLSNQGRLGLRHGVKLTAVKSKSVLDRLSVAQLKQELGSLAGPFNNVHNEVQIVRSNALAHAHAYLFFKTEKSMREALKLKCISVQEEVLVVKAALSGNEDMASADAGSGIFQLIADGICDRSRKGGTETFEEVMQAPLEMSPPLDSMEEESFKDQLLHTVSSNSTTDIASWQNTITVQGCINDNILHSITKFFSAFGMLKYYMQKDSSNDDVVLLEFKRHNDKETALMVQQFVVDGCIFRVDATSASNLLRVRLDCAKFLKKYPKDVIETCKKYGAVQRCIQKKSSVLEVHYDVHEWDRADTILKSIKEDESLSGVGAEIVCQGYQRCVLLDKQKLLDCAKQLVDHVNSLP